VDVTLSKRGDYVMRSAICLARAFADDRPRKIREVVEATEVPRSFASQILSDLVRAGLATSRAGRDGGYRLARSPEQVSVLEVVEAAEGPLRVDRCALGDGPCRWQDVCPLHETWSQVAVVLRDLLARTTLDEVAQRDAAIEAGTYAIPASSHRSHPTALELADTAQVELGAAQAHAALARASDHAGALAGRARELSLTPLGGEEEGHYLVAWRSLDGPVPSRAEGRVAVVAVDAERSELRAEVTWWPQAPPGAQLRPEGMEPAEHAKKELRAFLRDLARSLERPAATGKLARAGRKA
jgi:Rrf2 family protein